MEIIFVVFWFIGYDFEFRELFGRWIVWALFRGTFDVHDERMRSLDEMHCGMLMRFIGRVIACSVEATQAHVNPIRTILKSAAQGRNGGRSEDGRRWVPDCQSIGYILLCGRFGLH